MTFKNTKTSNSLSILFYAAVFLVAFEQIVWVFLGVDTEFKPYRLVIFFGFCFSLFSTWKVAGFLSRPILIFFGTYAFGLLLAFFWGLSEGIKVQENVREAIHLVVGIMFLGIFLITNKNILTLRRILLVILASCITSTVLWLLFGFQEEIYRKSCFFRNPNHYAYLIGVSILIANFFIFDKKAKVVTVILFVTFVLGGMVLILQSGSRSVLLLMFILWPTLFLRYLKLSGKRSFIHGAFFGIMGLILIVSFERDDFLTEKVAARFEGEQLSSTSGRVDIWKAGVLAAKDYNFLGLGLGRYREKHLFYLRELKGEIYTTVANYDLGLHNEYMVLLVEVGIIGLGLYLYFIIFVLRALRRAGKDDFRIRKLAILMETLFVFDMGFSLGQSTYNFPFHWIILGLCLSFLNIHYLNKKAAVRARKLNKTGRRSVFDKKSLNRIETSA